ncbi:hypothetical protein NEAUS06_2077 [Nematocida ausubeli]|nr:hypothetical protein NEAUS06_2077 [Nematocida ausubeli]
MHSVIVVNFSEKEVEIKNKEVKKKRRVVDVYDVMDPFYQEDEEVNTFECKYENFYCLTGESAVERRKEAEIEYEEKLRKDKKETARERYVKQKQEKLEEYAASSPEGRAAVLDKIAILELVTTQELDAKSLAEEVVNKCPDENIKELEKVLTKTFSKEGMEEMYAKAEEKKNALGEEVKVESLKRIKKDEATGRPEIQFDPKFLDLLVKYTDVEYLMFYIKLFLSGKKRILEHKVKKNAIRALHEYFPVECRSMSLGKKIASHVIKKRRRGQMTQSEGNADANSNTDEEAQDTEEVSVEKEESMAKEFPVEKEELKKEEVPEAIPQTNLEKSTHIPKEKLLEELSKNQRQPEIMQEIAAAENSLAEEHSMHSQTDSSIIKSSTMQDDSLIIPSSPTINPSTLVYAPFPPVQTKEKKQTKPRKAAAPIKRGLGKHRPPMDEVEEPSIDADVSQNDSKEILDSKDEVSRETQLSTPTKIVKTRKAPLKSAKLTKEKNTRLPANPAKKQKSAAKSPIKRKNAKETSVLKEKEDESILDEKTIETTETNDTHQGSSDNLEDIDM